MILSRKLKQELKRRVNRQSHQSKIQSSYPNRVCHNLWTISHLSAQKINIKTLFSKMMTQSMCCSVQMLLKKLLKNSKKKVKHLSMKILIKMKNKKIVKWLLIQNQIAFYLLIILVSRRRPINNQKCSSTKYRVCNLLKNKSQLRNNPKAQTERKTSQVAWDQHKR